MEPNWNGFLQDLLQDLVAFIERAKLVRAADKEEAQELLLRAKVAEENNVEITSTVCPTCGKDDGNIPFRCNVCDCLICAHCGDLVFGRWYCDSCIDIVEEKVLTDD